MGRGSRLLSGQVGIINLAASHVIMLTANWARGRRQGAGQGEGGIWIGIGTPSGPIRCKTESIKITMIGAESGGREEGEGKATTTVSDFFLLFQVQHLKQTWEKQQQATNDRARFK